MLSSASANSSMPSSHSELYDTSSVVSEVFDDDEDNDDDDEDGEDDDEDE